jgi:hypothetical protein
MNAQRTWQWWWDFALLPARMVVMVFRLKRQHEYVEHDYTKRRWGHDFAITEVYQNGKRLRITGWGHGLKEGHYLILPNKQTGRSTRYQIMSLGYYSAPRDMWFADAEFAPRRVSA